MSSIAAGQTRQGWHSVLVGGIATFMGAPLVEPDAPTPSAQPARGWPSSACRSTRPRSRGPAPSWAPGRCGTGRATCCPTTASTTSTCSRRSAWSTPATSRWCPANAPKTVDLVADAMGEALKAGAMPLLCGGEHITTIGGSLAVDRHAPGTYGLILMDTHLDTAPHVGGETINHCCPITRAMELDSFDPATCVIIGPHGAMNPKTEYAYVREAGVTVFHVSDVDRLGARAVAEQAVAIASAGTDGVYFSFDIDCLDSSVAPGTCVPTMGGLTSREALAMVSVIGTADLVAMDVTEVAPAYDHGQSAMAACQVIVDTLAAYADSHSEVVAG